MSTFRNVTLKIIQRNTLLLWPGETETYYLFKMVVNLQQERMLANKRKKLMIEKYFAILFLVVKYFSFSTSDRATISFVCEEASCSCGKYRGTEHQRLFDFLNSDFWTTKYLHLFSGFEYNLSQVRITCCFYCLLFY